jgi:hypothetical protein
MESSLCTITLSRSWAWILAFDLMSFAAIFNISFEVKLEYWNDTQDRENAIAAVMASNTMLFFENFVLPLLTDN